MVEQSTLHTLLETEGEINLFLRNVGICLPVDVSNNQSGDLNLQGTVRSDTKMQEAKTIHRAVPRSACICSEKGGFCVFLKLYIPSPLG
jgi:hypothetical protein